MCCEMVPKSQSRLRKTKERAWRNAVNCGDDNGAAVNTTIAKDSRNST
jgi:hypothetical protein